MLATSAGDGVILSPSRDFARLDGGLFEMTLLLPQEQATRLEAVARAHGLTVGQIVRRLIGDFTNRQDVTRQDA